MDNIYNPKWKALLIGGSSGVGKTVVASELAKHLSVSLLLLDDIRIAIQQVTTKETNPELHVFLNYGAEQWRKSESIYADWITVGKAMAKPLNAIIDHHVSILAGCRREIFQPTFALFCLIFGNCLRCHERNRLVGKNIPQSGKDISALFSTGGNNRLQTSIDFCTQ